MKPSSQFGQTAGRCPVVDGRASIEGQWRPIEREVRSIEVGSL